MTATMQSRCADIPHEAVFRSFKGRAPYRNTDRGSGDLRALAGGNLPDARIWTAPISGHREPVLAVIRLRYTISHAERFRLFSGSVFRCSCGLPANRLV